MGGSCHLQNSSCGLAQAVAIFNNQTEGRLRVDGG